MTHGRPDGPPLMVGGSLSRVGGRPLRRARRGDRAWRRRRGALVDVSALEVMAITLANYPTIQASLPGGPRKRSTFLMVPGIEPCADGYVGIATITAEQWHTFLAMIGRPDLAADDSLLVQPRRVERPDVIEAIRAWTRRHTVAEVVEQATLHRIPVVPIGNGRDAARQRAGRAPAASSVATRAAGSRTPARRSGRARPTPGPSAPAPALGAGRRRGPAARAALPPLWPGCGCST